MSASPQRFWRELVARLDRDPASVQAMGRQLDRETPAAVDAQWIRARLLQAGSLDASLGSAQVTGRRQRRRQLAAALLLLCLVPALGWTGARVLWPQRQHARSSMTERDQIALLLPNSSASDLSKLSAIRLAAERLESCIGLLVQVADAAPTGVAAVARAELAAMGRTDSGLRASSCAAAADGNAPLRDLDGDAERLLAVAVDAAAPLEQRITAARSAGAAMRASIQVMRDCRFGESAAARAGGVLLARLQRLARAGLHRH